MVNLLVSVLTGAAVYLAVGHIAGTRTAWRAATPRTNRRGLRTWLRQSGTGFTPARFWALSLTITSLSFFLLVGVTGSPAVALFPAAAAGFMPAAYLAQRRTARMAEVQGAWPDGLRDLSASVASGMSLAKALEALVARGPIPLRFAFARYPVLARSLGVGPALEAVKEELADPTSDRVIEVLLVAQERGGSIVVPIMEDLTRATTRDLHLAEEMRSEMLEQKINSRAVFVLPWLVLVALTLQDGPFRDFYSSSAGTIVLALAALASLGGMVWAARLARVPPERRVWGRMPDSEVTP